MRFSSLASFIILGSFDFFKTFNDFTRPPPDYSDQLAKHAELSLEFVESRESNQCKWLILEKGL